MTLKQNTQHATYMPTNMQWPSIILVICTYAVFCAATSVVAAISLPLAITILALVITLHSSLQHEALHGHIFNTPWLRYLSVFPAIGIFIPYERFCVTHLHHHKDINLTDPYDDPETNFLNPKDWQKLSWMKKILLNVNNTLLGRMLLGPMISLSSFYRRDIIAMMRGELPIIKAYLMHGLGVLPVMVWLILYGQISLPLYLIAAYLGLGILKIRTYLEHRAHDHCECRSVIVEDRGIFAFLFLNNNFHALHHEAPSLPWYQLPDEYFAKKASILNKNDHYFYQSYGQVFRQYLFRRKDPVPHPLRP